MDYKQFEGHTPGPWHFVTSHKGFLGQSEEEMQPFLSIMQTRDGNGTNACIAEIEEGTETSKFSDGYKHRITKDVAKANAHLIAAAPDLLKENQELKLELQKQKELNASYTKEFALTILNDLKDQLYQVITVDIHEVEVREIQEIINKYNLTNESLIKKSQ